jgi:nucleoside-diphosphate-sugar epimerase
MNVLLTGGAGYLGSRVTAHLLQGGASVTVLDKLIYGGEALLPFHGHPRFKLERGDVRNASAVAATLKGKDAIVHFAAVVGEPACSIDPEQAWSINVDGTKTVLAAAREAGTSRFIFLSTCSNYGVAKPNELANEESPLNPLSEYARAKVECEQLVLTELPPPTCTVLRLGTICGLSGRMRFDLLVSEMAKKCALGETIDIFSPDAWRPFLHVVDAARAIEHILNSSTNQIAQRVFNVVGENYQKRGLVELALRHFPQSDIIVTEKNPDLRDYKVDSSRIQRQLGFEPRYSVEDAFCETAQAVMHGIFRDPNWAGHSAIPLDRASFRRE